MKTKSNRIDINFKSANINNLEEISILIDKAINNMNKRNIDQWDSIYPTREDIKEDIEKNQLFIGCINNKIAVIYVLNQECDDDYNNGNWRYIDSTYYVIHRLCVNPEFQNQGIARETMYHIEGQVISMKGNSIRLDAFSKNPYALRLYEKCGYNKVGSANWRKGEFYLMEKYLV